MCGIAGIHLRNPEASVGMDAAMVRLLMGIEHRGKDATGYAAQTPDGQVYTVRGALAAHEFIKEAPALPRGTRSVILHTRFATQGHQGFMENNHPIQCGDTYVVHNGHIWNDDEVIKIAGFERRGRVDSEAIPQIMEHYGWEKALTGLEVLYGGFAIAALNRTRPGEVLLAKGPSSPLYVYVSKSVVMWASTRYTLEQAWKNHVGTFNGKKVIELRDGDFVRCQDDVVTFGEFNPLYYETPKGYQTWDDDDWTDAPSNNATAEEWNEYFRQKYGSGTVRMLPERTSTSTSTSAYAQPWEEEMEWDDDTPSLPGELIRTASGYELSPKLQKALDAMGERARRQRQGVEEDGEETPIITVAPTRVQVDSDGVYWIACASCLELTELDEMEGEDELYCWSCWTHLTDQVERGR